MRGVNRRSGLRPRELRRRVVLPARLRCGSQWSDACILNLSSRGMMIRTGYAAQEGSIIEVRRDQHIIGGRVMWRNGSKIGLHCDDGVPVDDILTLGACASLRLVSHNGALLDRRRLPRPHRDQPRHAGRLIQFAAILTIVLLLAFSGVLWVRATLAAPLRAAETALAS